MTSTTHILTNPTSDATITFTPDTLTIDGHAYPVAYSVTPTGRVFVFVAEENGERTQICIETDSPYYRDALCATKPEPHNDSMPTADTEQAALITFTGDTATILDTIYQAQYVFTPNRVSIDLTNGDEHIHIDLKPGDEFYTDALRAAQTALNVKPQATKPTVTHTAAPVDKPWIGTTIKGKGWEIYFDGAHDRTRVIFKKPPCSGVKELLKEFGFYWSPTLKSWNKGLTCKAYRAAQTLAAHLRYYPNKPLFT